MSGGNYKQCFIVGGEKHLFILDICVSLKYLHIKTSDYISLPDVLTLGTEILKVLYHIALGNRPIAEAF